MSILNEDSHLPIGNDDKTPIELDVTINQAKQKKGEYKKLKNQIKFLLVHYHVDQFDNIWMFKLAEN